MKIKPEHLEQLELEVQHIFDSGANEIRLYEMIKAFIERRGIALFIHDVVGRSEQLLALAQYMCEHQNNLDGKTAKDYLQDFLSQ